MAKNKQTETANAEVTEPVQATAPVKQEQTSEKLETLKSEHIKLQNYAATLPAGSDERNDADIASYKKAQEIKAEKANIVIAEQAALVAEKRNARVKFADDLIEAVKGGNEEEIAAAREIVVNELLSKFAGAQKSATVKTGTSTGTRGAATAAIRALIVPMYAAGATGSEVRKSVIHEHGFNDGTANAAILKYEQEIGLK